MIIRTIPLTGGKHAIVDDADFERLSQWKWYACRRRNNYYALQAEEDKRSISRFERLLRSARFRYRASIEELDYTQDRGLDKSLMTDLGFFTKE